MKFSLAAAAVALATAVSAQSLTINTPTTGLYTCEPAQLQWSGGSGPYYVRVLAGGTTSDVIETLVSGQNVNSYTWNVNVAAGTSITLGVTDSTGSTNYAQQVTVTQGSSTSCVGEAVQGSSGSAAATGSSSVGSSAASSAAAASTTMASMASSASSGASSVASRASSAVSGAASAASSGAAAASQSAKSSAGKNAVVSGLAGVAAVAAFLA